MPRENLGEFEQIVMLAIVHLKGEVYGVPIVDEIERRTGREVTRAAVYITLRRLEQKGLVASWMGDPTAERGGKARRCVKLTSAGLRTLKESRDFLNLMWRGVELNVKDAR
jgi:DNA-binding PadR family transcriptional regulator